MEISLVCGLIGMFGWGIADFIQAHGIRSIGTPQAMMIRNLMTLILSLAVGAVLLATGDVFWPMGNVALIFLSSAVYVVGYTFYMRGIEFGRLSIVEPISSSYALITLFLMTTLADEIVTEVQVLGIFVTVFGIVFVAGDPRKIVSSGDRTSIVNGGIALALFGVAFAALGAGSRGLGGVDAFLLSAFSQSILFLTMSLMIGARFRQVRKAPSGMLRIFLYHSVILNIAWVGYIYGAAYGNISIVTAVSSAFGGVGALLGILLFRERLRLSQYFGIAMIVAGVVVVSG
ncbi:EamA family transporter [Salinarimonas chemoclinalis]|uniref:EamA family transporter n=1 Tax=Salinarimonas chemoclinalis TaxID=3241599 RepID=UPI0035561F73